jgi:hypothetical protein
MPQTVPETPALRHLAKVILRHELDLAAKQWQQHGVPPPRSWRLARARDWAVGLAFSGVALLLTIASYSGERDPRHWLFFVTVALAIRAAGVKAGRVAAVASMVSYFGVLAAVQHSASWQAIQEPKLWHLAAGLACMLLCATPRGMSGAYTRRMRRIIARIAARTPVSPSSLNRRRNTASIIARISVSSASGLPERMRSVSTS